MSEWLQALLLAFIQGLTEFLPISSSAHLILPAQLLGWTDQGVAFDIAVHLGSLLAVLLYFREALYQLLIGSLRALAQRQMNADAQLVLQLGVATLPVAVAGILLKDLVEGQFRSVPVIAAATIGFGLLLALADRRGGGSRQLDMAAAAWIGLAQVLALVPGTSRSGITMTAGLFCGLGREQAARFSFLLSIPVILAASALAASEFSDTGQAISWAPTALATVVAALTAYATIALFLEWVQRLGFLPFAIYRCLLGAVLLWIWF